MKQNIRRLFHSMIGPLTFSFLIMIVEFLEMIDIFNDQPKSFRGLVLTEGWNIAQHLAGFAVRYLFLFIFFAVVLWIIEQALRVQRRWLFYILISIYAFAYGLLYYPQLFDEFRNLFPVYRWLVAHMSPWHVYAIASMVLLFLIWEFFRSSATWKRAPAAIVVLGILGYYLFIVQSFPSEGFKSNVKGSSAQVGDSKKKNVIILSMDSLRPEMSLVDAQNPEQEKLYRVLNRSFKMNHVIASVAQTHPSFTSLFTGKNPQHHGLRYLLSHKGLEVDSLFDGSPLQSLKKAGYSVTFMNDENDYVYFREGKTIDKTVGGMKGVGSLILPLFFRSRLFFGLFNNEIGFSFFPEIRANSAFSTAYKLPYYTNMVKDELKSLAKSDKPFVFVAHSCALHWPGHLTYPYFPKNGFDKGAPYAYATRTFHEREERLGFWNARVDYQKEIYADGVKLVRDQFLLPLLDQLEELKLLDNSVVILMSDHGENLWDQGGRLPQRKAPEHGSTLIFGGDSELATLSIQLPGLQGHFVNKTAGLIDVLPTVIDYLGLSTPPQDGVSLLKDFEGQPRTQQLYYTETGVWPLQIFSGQFRSVDAANFFSIFNMDPQSGLVYIPEEQEHRVMSQKQRAVYKDDYKLIIYPTFYGYRTFLCNLKEDRQCRKDLSSQNPQLFKEMIDGMLDFIKPDIAHHYILPLKFSKDAATPLMANLRSDIDDQLLLASAQKDIHSYEWLVYQRGLELMYRYHDFRRGLVDLQWLMDQQQVNSQLKQFVKGNILEVCAHGGFVPEHRPQIDFAFKRGSDEYDQMMAKGHFTPLLKCAANLRDSALTKFVNSTMDDMAKVSPGIALTRDEIRRQVTKEKLQQYLGSVDSNSQVAMRIYQDLYKMSPRSERPAYQQVIRNHPLYADVEQEEKFEDLMDSDQTYDELMKDFKAEAGYAWSYHVPDELMLGYQSLLSNLNRVSPEMAVMEALRQLTEQELSLRQSWLILNYMDIMSPLPRALTINHLGVRKIPWKMKDLHYESDIRAFEVALAQVSGESFFCKNPASHKEFCIQAKHWVENNPLALQWKRFIWQVKEASQQDLKKIMTSYASDEKNPGLIRELAREIAD